MSQPTESSYCCCWGNTNPPRTEPQNKDKEFDDMVALLKKLKTDLEEQKDQLRVDLEKVVTEREKNKEQLRSVEAEITAREQNFDKPEELLREKENLLKEQWKLDERKKYLEKEIIDREKLLEPIETKFPKEKETSVYVNIP